jgi:hypothetical protein
VEGRGSADELAIGVGGWIEAVLRALAVLGPAGVRLSDMVSFVFYGFCPTTVRSKGADRIVMPSLVQHDRLGRIRASCGRGRR